MEVEQLTNIQQLRSRQFPPPSLSDTLEDGADGKSIEPYHMNRFLAAHHLILLLSVDQRSTTRMRICREDHSEEQKLSDEDDGINVAVE